MLISAHKNRLIFVCVSASLLLLMGCGEVSSPDPIVYPVTGEVFVKGQPAEGATVILHPQNPDPAVWKNGFPRGTVQADGKFEIQCYESAPGAPPGQYKLLTQWLTGEAGQEENEAAPPRQNRINPAYFDAARSPWSVQVAPQPNQVPRIEIP